MPYESPTPPDVITDDLVLAALDRAVLHRSGRPAPARVVFAHLALRPRMAKARRVRVLLDALLEAGSVEQSRAHGVQVWALTAKGKRRLSRVRHVTDLLPESPQHGEWRSAQSAAGEVIEGFREYFRASLADAAAALEDPAVTSDEWFDLQDRLEAGARRIASATYCLREWAEPDDSRADVDDRTDPTDEAYEPESRKLRKSRRLGRRSPMLWFYPDARPPEMDWAESQSST